MTKSKKMKDLPSRKSDSIRGGMKARKLSSNLKTKPRLGANLKTRHD